MAQTTVNFRMDENLKIDLERLCDDLGITMTTAFTVFAKKATKENRIPFELTGDPFYSKKNMSRLEQSITNYESGKSTPIIKTMAELEAMESE